MEGRYGPERGRARGKSGHYGKESGRGNPPPGYGDRPYQQRPGPPPGMDTQPKRSPPSDGGGGGGNGRGNGNGGGFGRGNGNGGPPGRGGGDGNGAAGPSATRGSTRGSRTVYDTVRTRTDAATKKGTTGNQIVLQANYFKLINMVKWTIFQYRVDFSPIVHSPRLQQGLIHEHKKKFGGFLFDGTQLFMLHKLPQDKIEIQSKHERTGEVYKIMIQHTGTVDMTDFKGLQVLNLILRRAMGGLKLQLVGRNLFDAAARIEIREHRIELWPGYITSIRQHERDVLLCCEITHKVMRIQTCYDVMVDCSKNNRDFQQEFKRQLLGCIVLTSYNNKTYRIDDVNYELTPLSSFSTKSGDTTFLTYYKSKYNITIRDPKQPMLISRAKKKDLRGGQAELTALVPELCQMTGLTDQMRTDYRMMNKMSEHTRLNPDRRIERLEMFNRRLQNSQESQQLLREWSTELDKKLVEIPGRQLPIEMIYFSTDRDGLSATEKADWQNAFRNNQMFSSFNLTHWYLVTPDRCSREALEFKRNMIDVARGMRFTISDCEVIRIQDDRPDSYVRQLDTLCNRDPQMIVCVVSNNKSDRYTAIKKKCCIERAIPTQVLVHKTITPKGGNARNLMSVASKVVIQMNCKMGGVPWKVKIPMNGMMTIGFDVCHDTNDKSKSFGAMVCTMEKDYKQAPKFFSCVSQHANGEEISNYLPLNIGKALQAYKREFNELPKKIFFYRDGVGEGQLQYVYSHEVTAIEQKLKQIYKSYGDENVCFTFIVVNKRINTRLFNRRQNPLPGTIVDDVITLPERTDFYLVSQSVRQGTVSPTAYNILFDKSGLTADRIQQLTYKQCHIYYNWAGTTRVPAVCQYAHKLAFLVGQYLHFAPSNLLEKQLYFL